MSREYSRPDSLEGILSMPALLQKMEQQEPLDLEKGRVALIARIKHAKGELLAEYERRHSEASVDSWNVASPTPKLQDLHATVATLMAVWDALKHEQVDTTYPYKHKPQFIQGCAYLEREVRREHLRVRKQARQMDGFSLVLTEDYLRTRNELATLKEIRASSPRSPEGPLGKEYFLAGDYDRPTRPMDQVHASVNLLDLWPQLKEGVRLRIDTDERVIHLSIERVHIAGDGRLVIEGLVAVGQFDMPTNYPIRVVTSGGSTPNATISLREHEHFPSVMIKQFSLEKS